MEILMSGSHVLGMFLSSVCDMRVFK